MNLSAQDFWVRTNNLIKKRNLTQIKVCEMTEIPLQTFRGWILHGRLPDAIQICNIANYLNMSVEFLVTGKDCLPPEIKEIELKLMKLNETSRNLIIQTVKTQLLFIENNKLSK